MQVFILQDLHAAFAYLLILLTFAHAMLRSREKRGVPPPGFFACVHFAHVSLQRIGPGAGAEGAVVSCRLDDGRGQALGTVFWLVSGSTGLGAGLGVGTTSVRRGAGGMSSG